MLLALTRLNLQLIRVDHVSHRGMMESDTEVKSFPGTAVGDQQH